MATPSSERASAAPRSTQSTLNSSRRSIPTSMGTTPRRRPRRAALRQRGRRRGGSSGRGSPAPPAPRAGPPLPADLAPGGPGPPARPLGDHRPQALFEDGDRLRPYPQGLAGGDGG